METIELNIPTLEEARAAYRNIAAANSEISRLGRYSHLNRAMTQDLRRWHSVKADAEVVLSLFFGNKSESFTLVDKAELAELTRKARRFDDLQHARELASAKTPDNEEWQKLALENPTNLIPAIKMFRTKTGTSLSEARDAVEGFVAEQKRKSHES